MSGFIARLNADTTCRCASVPVAGGRASRYAGLPFMTGHPAAPLVKEQIVRRTVRIIRLDARHPRAARRIPGSD